MLRCKNQWMLLIALWLWTTLGLAALPHDIAGYVTRVRGDVAVENAAGRQPLALGQPLHLRDHIVTGANARLEAQMRDGMTVTLGENTEFAIQQVMGVSANSENSIFELIKGVFRSATHHAEGKPLPREPCRVETPVATIGIRGTELWGGFNLLDSGSTTLDVVMLDGKGVYVESAGQRVELKQAGDGTTVKGTGQVKGPGQPPTPLKVWGDKKLQAAQQTVAW